MDTTLSVLPIYLRCAYCGKILFPSEGMGGEHLRENDRIFCTKDCMGYARHNTPLENIPSRSIAEPSISQRFSPEEIDPVMVEVINGALTSICEDMGWAMARTAHSAVFYEGRDFTCALFDKQTELLAQFEGNPSQLGSLKLVVRAGLTKFGISDHGEGATSGDLSPGDVIIHNDAFLGGTHLPEIVLIAPVFYRDELVGYAANIGHHTDIGGKSPGGFPADAVEIYQEGIIIPPAKLFEKGKRRDEILRILLVNIRNPRHTYGDLMAMYGSLIVAQDRMKELMDKYGLETVLKYSQEVKNYSERRIRAEILRIPQGIYEGSCPVDDDGRTDKQYCINVRVKVEKEDLLFDFRKTSSQAKGPINATYGVGCSSVANAIFHLLDPTIPHNEGAFRPLHFIIPPGKLINALYPSPISGGNTETINLVATATINALSHAIPQRVTASGGATVTILNIGGTDTRNGRSEPYAMCMWDPAGWGGLLEKDGETAVMTFCGTTSKNYPVEVIETIWPWRVNRYEVREDSGGPGKQRGGLGIVREYELLGESARVGGHSNRHKFPPEGLFGGGEAAGTEYLISLKALDEEWLDPTRCSSTVVSPTKFAEIPFRKGDKILIRTPGGGGYGNPADRDREQVREDLKNGYISLRTAVDSYGMKESEAKRIVKEYWFQAAQ